MNPQNDGAAMREGIRGWIEYYNNDRVHSKNGRRKPKDAYEKLVFQLEHHVLLRELLDGAALHAALHKKLLRSHAAQSLVDIVGGAFRGKKLARAYVEERQTYERFAEMDGGEEVVLARRQYVVVHRHAWRHKLDRKSTRLNSSHWS